MNKPIAIVDVDDTLANMRASMCEALNKHCNTSIHWSKWNTFNVEHMYGINYDEFFHVLKKYKVIERLQPHEESSEFTAKLRDRGYKVTLLTARKWHDYGEAVTRRWAKDNEIYYDDVVVCSVEDCKSEIISEMFSAVNFTVDDSATHCKKFVRNSKIKNVFVYDMPWNKCQILDGSRATRISNLNQIIENIKE